jgi:putative membrane protein
MTTRLILASLHLVALGIGLGAVWGRARAASLVSRNATDDRLVRRVLAPDSWWGVAAILWLVTGLWRLFASTEKTTTYYLTNDVFYAKMGLFVLILLLEIWPMVTLIRWRTGKAKPTTRAAGRIAIISYIESLLVVAIVLAAVSMARGLGAR